jgi:hypothetical protein
MRSRTSTLVLDAPKEAVFSFLADIENLPLWAINFCKALRRTSEGWKILTPEGEMFFRIDADSASGVVDMRGGPDSERMAYWPARVVALPDGKSALIFTNFQWPGVADEVFERQCDGLAHEFTELHRLVRQ